MSASEGFTPREERLSIHREVPFGPLQGMRKLESPHQMNPEYRDTFMKIIYALASTEFASAEQHRPFIGIEPTIEDRFIHAQIVADESHQGLDDCRVLMEFGDEGAKLVEDVLSRRLGSHKLSLFNVPLESWADVVAYSTLADQAAWYHFKALEDCSYGPFARSMTMQIVEEAFHWSYGRNRMKKVLTDPTYAKVAGVSKDDVQQSISKLLPKCLDIFGRSKSKFSDLAVFYSIRRWGNEELRKMYYQDVSQFLSELGFEVPSYEQDREYL